MRRREFIALIAGAAVASPIVARAQRLDPPKDLFAPVRHAERAVN